MQIKRVTITKREAMLQVLFVGDVLTPQRMLNDFSLCGLMWFSIVLLSTWKKVSPPLLWIKFYIFGKDSLSFLVYLNHINKYVYFLFYIHI